MLSRNFPIVYLLFEPFLETCLRYGVSNLQLTSLDITDTHHTPEEGWNLGHWKTQLAAPAINWERCNSRHHLLLHDHPDPARSYKIARGHLFLPWSPQSFPMWGEKEKRFVVKENVIGGVCRGARLRWLEWDCPEENRSVPRSGEQPTCGPLGEAV